MSRALQSAAGFLFGIIAPKKGFTWLCSVQGITFVHAKSRFRMKRADEEVMPGIADWPLEGRGGWGGFWWTRKVNIQLLFLCCEEKSGGRWTRWLTSSWLQRYPWAIPSRGCVFLQVSWGYLWTFACAPLNAHRLLDADFWVWLIGYVKKLLKSYPWTSLC